MTMRGRIGEQGVALVTAELIARDLNPYRPVVDDHGVDIMLLDGSRIQVKTANLSAAWSMDKRSRKTFPTGKMAYQFSLQRTVFGTQEKLRSVGVTYEYRDIAKDADFLILVGLDERRFWIVPSALIDGCCHVTMVQGPSHTKNGPRFRFWQAIRDGEGRWDLLVKPVTISFSIDTEALRLDERPDDIASFAGWLN